MRMLLPLVQSWPVRCAKCGHTGTITAATIDLAAKQLRCGACGHRQAFAPKTIVRARRFYAGLIRNQQAEHVARDLGRYEASSWQNARAEATCPHRDGRRQLLWRILKARPTPPKARTVDQILAKRS
jgi:hypothetical protein